MSDIVNFNENIKNLIKITCSDTLNALDNLKKKDLNIEHIDINCKDLKEECLSVYKGNVFHEEYSHLDTITGPVLYWFNIINEIPTHKIVENFKLYSNKKARATPALKKTIDQNTKCLYVGKVKKSFSSRIFQHLGYYTVERTQGLQLMHWTKTIDLQLCLNYIQFASELEDLMTLFENHLAKELKPIIGKHK